MARTCYIKTKLRMGEEFISVSDLKNDANYNFISIVNGDQDNLYLKDNYNEISSSPLNDFNFNCDYYDEHETIAKLALSKGTLTCLSLNIQSLPSKYNEFLDLINQFSSNNIHFDIIALQELWTINDPDIFAINGYKFIFKSRKKGTQGGGVGFYIKKI